MYRILAICLLGVPATGLTAEPPSSSAGKRIAIAKKEFSVAPSESGRTLVVTTPKSSPMEIEFGNGKITSFRVAEWYDGAGIVLVAEVESGGLGPKEYGYYWATMWVEKGDTWKSQADGREFGLVAKYPIVTRFDKLTIGKLEGHGDGLSVFLIDPVQVPNSEQHLVLDYQHNCAIGPIQGRLRRTFAGGEKLKGFDAP